MDTILGLSVATIGAVLLGAGAVGLFYRPVASSVGGFLTRTTRLGNPMAWMLIILVLGVFLGGWGVISGFATASISGGQSEQLQTISGQVLIERCDYSSGSTGVLNSAISLRADTNSNSVVIADVDESLFNASNNNANGDANVSFTCFRAGGVDKAGSVKAVLTGSEFTSETDVSTSTIYNIVERTSSTSGVTGKPYTLTAYIANGAVATSSSPKESNYLTFAEGTQSATLGVNIEIDRTAYSNLKNYTTKDVKVDVGGKTATIRINKIP